MHYDQRISTIFCRVNEIFNSMRNLGDEIKYATTVDNMLR